MKQSIDYAMAHRDEAVKYAMQYGRGMDAGLTDQFVGMYVNKWTQDMGRDGRASISRLLTRGYHAAVLPRPVNLEFVE
jgi:1,4-dihydroxy-6-naphthoate synthase